MPPHTRLTIRYYHDVLKDAELWPGSQPNVLIVEQDWDEERKMYRTVMWTDDITDHHRFPMLLQHSYAHIKKAE